MSRRVVVAVIFAFCSLPLASWAQDTLYVTDKLILGLYAKPEANADSLATLVSGTPLQALERGKYFTRVRTPDGTEGWVKSAYLVEEKPPRLMLDEVQAANEQLKAQLQRTRRELDELKTASSDADTQLQKLRVSRDQRSTELERLQSQNLRLQQRVATQQQSVPLSWLIGTGVLALVLGAWAGYAWIDYRIRRRHGGFRIY